LKLGYGLLFFWHNAPVHPCGLAVCRSLRRTRRVLSAWSVETQCRAGTFYREKQANALAMRDFFRGRFGEMGADAVRAYQGGG
jgi:hypothetical protein